MPTDQTQRPPVRRIRVVALAFFGVLLAFFVGATLYVGVKRYCISSFDAGFANVRIGDGEADVMRTMGPPTYVRVADQFHLPENPNIEGENGSGAKQLCFRVDTFFLPIDWVVTIDSNGHVKNKFRLD